MTEAKQYKGSCHCGAVAFEVNAPIEEVIECNCSICSRLGYMLAFVPMDAVKFIKGEQEMSDYRFNHKVIHHTFCPTCGVHAIGSGTMPDGSETYAINARCLEGVDTSGLKVIKYDGRSV